MSRKSKAAEFLEEAYNISVTGRNVLVTDSMKDYAIEKVSKIERFSNRIIDVIITMDVQKLVHRVDIVLKINTLLIKCSASTDNMYASIDKVVDKLEAKILRYKEKLQDYHHNRGNGASFDMDLNILRPSDVEEINEINSDIESENQQRLLDKYRPHKIVKKEKRPLKTLSDGEALLKMELSGDSFLVYCSEEDRKIRVIYRRDDGDFGVLQPELKTSSHHTE